MTFLEAVTEIQKSTDTSYDWYTVKTTAGCELEVGGGLSIGIKEIKLEIKLEAKTLYSLLWEDTVDTLYLSVETATHRALLEHEFKTTQEFVDIIDKTPDLAAMEPIFEPVYKPVVSHWKLDKNNKLCMLMRKGPQCEQNVKSSTN